MNVVDAQYHRNARIGDKYNEPDPEEANEIQPFVSQDCDNADDQEVVKL